MITKDRILEEALTLFSQQGYEAISVEQIAAAVCNRQPEAELQVMEQIEAHVRQFWVFTRPVK